MITLLSLPYLNFIVSSDTTISKTSITIKGFISGFLINVLSTITKKSKHINSRDQDNSITSNSKCLIKCFIPYFSTLSTLLPFLNSSPTMPLSFLEAQLSAVRPSLSLWLTYQPFSISSSTMS